MYARLIHFMADPARKPELISLMDRVMPKIKSQKGCKDCMFLADDAAASYAVIVLWETEAHADAAAHVIGPLMLPGLNRIADEPVVPLLYNVYRPEVMLQN